MRNFKFEYLGLICLLIVSCGGTQKEFIQKTTDQPAKEQVIKEECKSISHPDKKPIWLYNEPEKKENFLYFVGLSGNFTMEKDAREDAYNNSIKQAAKYIGTEIYDKTSTIYASYGLSSEIIDPTVARKQIEEQLTEAIARKVKSKEWYVEKCKKKYKTYSEEYFSVRVLSYASEETINSEIARQEAYQKELVLKIKNVNNQLSKAKTIIREADSISASRPCYAYSKYSEAIDLAERAKIEVQVYSEVKLKKIIEMLQPVIDKAKSKMELISKNPEALLKCTLLALVSDYQYKPVNVSIASICFQDTELSTDFSKYLVSKIEENLSEEPALYKVIAQNEFQKELARNKISIDDCLSGKSTANLKGLLFVRYWDRQDSIELQFQLKEIGSKNLIKASSINLTKTIFPEDMNYKPADKMVEGWNKFKEVKESGDFKVEIYPDRGESAIYYEGEFVKFHLKSTKDCYIYIYHMDSEGKVILLFPNAFNSDNYISADKLCTIPETGSGFKLQISPPFGNEIVKAIALLQPIKEIDTSGLSKEEGFLQLGNVQGLENSVGYRAIKIVAENKAENVCTIKTMRK